MAFEGTDPRRPTEQRLRHTGGEPQPRREWDSRRRDGVTPAAKSENCLEATRLDGYTPVTQTTSPATPR
jgi:hypothetical protein